MGKRIGVIALLVFLFLLSGCGMDDSSSSDPQSTQLGLVDYKNKDLGTESLAYPVTGVDIVYSNDNNDTNVSTQSALNSTAAQSTDTAMKTATFKLGNLTLGTADVNQSRGVFLLSDLKDNKNGGVLDNRVLKITKLLVSLDKDANISNGIDVSNVGKSLSGDIGRMSLKDIDTLLSSNGITPYTTASVGEFLKMSHHLKSSKFTNSHNQLLGFFDASESANFHYSTPSAGTNTGMSTLAAIQASTPDQNNSAFPVITIDTSKSYSWSNFWSNTGISAVTSGTMNASTVKSLLGAYSNAAKVGKSLSNMAAAITNVSSRTGLQIMIESYSGVGNGELTNKNLKSFISEIGSKTVNDTEGTTFAEQYKETTGKDLDDLVDDDAGVGENLDTLNSVFTNKPVLNNAFTTGLSELNEEKKIASVADETSLSSSMQTLTSVKSTYSAVKDFSVLKGLSAVLGVVGAVSEFAGPFVDMYMMSMISNQLTSMTNAIQQEQTEINQLQTEINALSSEVNDLVLSDTFNKAYSDIKIQVDNVTGYYGLKVDDANKSAPGATFLDLQAALLGYNDLNTSVNKVTFTSNLNVSSDTQLQNMHSNTDTAMQWLVAPGGTHAIAVGDFLNEINGIATNEASSLIYEGIVYSEDTANSDLSKSILYYFADELAAKYSDENLTNDQVYASMNNFFLKLLTAQAQQYKLQTYFYTLGWYYKRYADSSFDIGATTCTDKDDIETCIQDSLQTFFNTYLPDYNQNVQEELEVYKSAIIYLALKIDSISNNTELLNSIYDDMPIVTGATTDKYYSVLTDVMTAINKEQGAISATLTFPSGMLTYNKDGIGHFSDENSTTLDIIIQGSTTQDFSSETTKTLHTEVNSSALVQGASHIVWTSDTEFTVDPYWNIFHFRYPLDENSIFGTHPDENGTYYFRIGVSVPQTNITNGQNVYTDTNGSKYYMSTSYMHFMDVNTSDFGVTTHDNKNMPVISINTGWYWGVNPLISDGGQTWSTTTQDYAFYADLLNPTDPVRTLFTNDGWDFLADVSTVDMAGLPHNFSTQSTPSFAPPVQMPTYLDFLDTSYSLAALGMDVAYESTTDSEWPGSDGSSTMTSRSYTFSYPTISFVASKNGYGDGNETNITLNILTSFVTTVSSGYTSPDHSTLGSGDGEVMMDLYRPSINLVDGTSFDASNAAALIQNNSSSLCPKSSSSGYDITKDTTNYDLYNTSFDDFDYYIGNMDYLDTNDTNTSPCYVFTYFKSDVGKDGGTTKNFSLTPDTVGTLTTPYTLDGNGSSVVLFNEIDYIPVNRIDSHWNASTASSIGLNYLFLYLTASNGE